MALFAAILSLILAANTLAFPQYEALVQRELEEIISRSNAAWPPSPPGPLNDTSAKLVNDRAHPFKAARPGIDMRGPCPGLNTLASHGYLPRNGIATPAQIINAVQEGFNMGNDLAVFVTYAAFLVDGNPLTNLMSIGGKSIFTGPDPPRPAIVGGLDTHAVFEGDASMTRGDAFFGDNHSFNETQFDEFVKFSNQFGGGKYNIQAATEFRWQRIQESIATNPNFSFISPRYFTAYAESTFPLFFFVDGRQADGQLSLDVARGFFQESRMPDGFFRANTSVGLDAVGNAIGVIFEAHPIAPGGNQGRVNSYTVDPNSADFTQFCKLYTDFVNITVKSLYPNPKGLLRTALNANLGFFFSPLQGSGCPQVFPFGQ